MKRLTMIITIMTFCAGLSACSSLRNHFSSLTSKSDSAYLKAKASPRLKIPAGLSSAKVGDNFNVPAASTHGPVPVAITPPGGIYKAKARVIS